MSRRSGEELQGESISMLEDTGHPLAQPASCNGHMVFSDDRRQQLTLTPAGHKNKETINNNPTKTYL